MFKPPFFNSTHKGPKPWPTTTRTPTAVQYELMSKTKLGDIRKTAGTSAGGYGAVTQITMPDGLEDGQYEIRHMVLLDGAAKSERIARFSYVAGSPAGSQVLALLGDSPLRN